MKPPRRTVHCWVCGKVHRRRREPEYLPIVGDAPRVATFGTCSQAECHGHLLFPADVEYVVSWALQHDRAGLNRTEADL